MASRRALVGALLLGAVLVAFTSGSATSPRLINVLAEFLITGGDSPDEQQSPGSLAALLARAPALFAAPASEGAGDQDIGFVVTWIGSIAVDESGTSDSFAVVLNGRPQSEMVILIWSEDRSEVVVSPLLLTFTGESWDRPQTVTVTGVDDSFADGDQLTAVTVSVASVAPGREHPLLRLTIEVTTADDDATGLDAPGLDAPVSEQESARAMETTDSDAIVLTRAAARGAPGRGVVWVTGVRPAAPRFVIA